MINIFKRIPMEGDNQMYSTISGYIIQKTLVGIDGKSIGETPHYFLQIYQPINRECYISDSNSDLYNDILTALCEANLINDKNYNIIMNNGMIELYKQVLICE